MISIVDYIGLPLTEVVERLEGKDVNLNKPNVWLLQDLIRYEAPDMDLESETIVSLDTFHSYMLQENIEDDFEVSDHLLTSFLEFIRSYVTYKFF